ncbi:methyltransferase [uncultured Rikenella sp.]|uniref:methyltransferase n=1 Tax=uncultured Rikenella sp. TaxID=368003 RepID=UPI00260D9E82|nr:methyltransferase [uncultured Rikenella sp.]
MEMKKLILDACCGARMMWFDKQNPLAVFMDCRDTEYTLCDGRKLEVHPDIMADFRQIPFPDGSFRLVVFDPPHLDNANPEAYMAQKYGTLQRVQWKDDLKAGFDECMRVLEPFGVLIFKWNETRVTVKRILEIISAKPLFGHKSGKASKTHWMCFMKLPK